MKKIIIIILSLPILLLACGNDNVAKQLKNEMQSLKEQCPQYLGDGLVMTDVNFYEAEKILEYVCSIEGIYYLEPSLIDEMKESMLDSFDNDISLFEELSIKTTIKQYDYTFRYIYTDIDGNELCTIDIDKNDL
ncbi:hypothetical protein LJC11_00675 [Bacteroidales bacterium OttesenSCG-928-I21]|nr:hypothetical protein [Bacteroidales bacterium OttesenSCG-928-I21]